MIRFQICIFDILNTAGSNDSLLNEGCDSLSNLKANHNVFIGGYCNSRAVFNMSKIQI